MYDREKNDNAFQNICLTRERGVIYIYFVCQILKKFVSDDVNHKNVAN